MGKPADVEFHRFSRRRGYSATVRTALAFSALVVTLLPIPVTYLGILPAYHLHALFLLFFAPFVCLLTLCYLFYVRDSLARAMFADVLDPPPAPDPYYREPRGERLKRGLRRAKAVREGRRRYSVLDDSFSSTSGFGLLGGLGYDVRVAHNLSVIPVANWFRGSFDGGSTNVLQLSVGVTSH